jgi:peptidoglycan L-alanyl-D-glutamate endopeptidase CwlK
MSNLQSLLPLIPAMRVKMEYVLEGLFREKITFRAYAVMREPKEQARLWRQSRSIEEINAAVKKLLDEGAPYLAKTLLDVGPQHGRWATNNLPGQSWHQYGEAIDLVLVSKAARNIWTSSHSDYERLADAAGRAGLTSGLNWRHRDVNHLQLRPEATRAYYSWEALNNLCKSRYGPLNGRNGPQD